MLFVATAALPRRPRLACCDDKVIRKRRTYRFGDGGRLFGNGTIDDAMISAYHISQLASEIPQQCRVTVDVQYLEAARRSIRTY